jgi:hypothetical protein
MRTSLTAIAALLAGLSLAHSAAAQTTQIGVAAAVRNQVTATLGAEARPLVVGGDVFQNDLVRTGESSVAQLLFADRTTLSVGPRSEVRLDRFVYDPSRPVGDVGISFLSGALRFISGSQNPQSYQIETPVAAIGVRGTIIDLLLIDGRLFGILVEGRCFFTLPNGEEIELDVPGTAIEFFSDGSASRPFTWRGRYEAGLRTASFPLYGNPFADTPLHEGASVMDQPTSRTDELSARNVPDYQDF